MGLIETVLQIPLRFFNWWRDTFNRSGLLGRAILGCSTILFTCCFCTFSVALLIPNARSTEDELTAGIIESASNNREDSQSDGAIVDVTGSPIEPAGTQPIVPTSTHEPTETHQVNATDTAEPTSTRPATATPTSTATAAPIPTNTIAATPTVSATETTAPEVPTATVQATQLAWDDGRLENRLSQLYFETYYFFYNPDNRRMLIGYRNPEAKGNLCEYPFKGEHGAVQFLVKAFLQDGYPDVERVFIEQVDEQETLLSRLTWVPAEDRDFYEGPEVFLERCR